MGTQYHATVTAEVPQVVRCAHCKAEFLYSMRKTGTGMVEPFFDLSPSKSQRQAEAIARQHLAEQLTPDNFNVVPCVHCYHYQPFMRERAAKLKYGSNRYIGLLLACFGVIVLFVSIGVLQSPQNRDTGVWVAVGGAGTILFGCWAHWFVRRLIATHDPSTQTEVRRRKLAEERCMTWSEFDLRQTTRLAREYAAHAGQEKRGKWLGKAETREAPAPSQLWLPPRAFLDGHTVALRLAPDKTVTLDVAPGTRPGTVVDLVPGGQNELPFQAILLSIFDNNEPPEDAD